MPLPSGAVSSCPQRNTLIEREEKTYLPLPDKTKEECGVFVPQVMFNTSVCI
jgi:hypothetical protein